MKYALTLLTMLGIIGFFGRSALWAEKMSQPLAFELLEKTKFSKEMEPVFPAELHHLEGKPVRISGFMIPYDDLEQLVKLILVKTPGGCFFCSPPMPNGIVFVRRSATDPPLKYTLEQISIEGILHLRRSEMKKDDEAKGFFFTIDEAKVVMHQ